MRAPYITGSLLFLPLLLGGCVSSNLYNSAKYRYNHPPLDPPTDNRWVEIEGKLQPEINVQLVTHYYATGECYEKDGNKANIYLLDTIKPDTAGNYIRKVPSLGGTRCQWKLYQVDFSTYLADLNFYNDRIPNIQQYAPIESGSFTQKIIFKRIMKNAVKSLVNVDALLYPKVSLQPPITAEGFADKSTAFFYYAFKTLDGTYENITRDIGEEYYYHDDLPLPKINFSPIVDQDYLVYSTTEGSKLTDDYIIRFHYPNGDVTVNEKFRNYRYDEFKPIKKEEPWNPIIPD